MKLTRRTLISLVILILFPVLLNGPGLFGGAASDPIALYGDFPISVQWDPLRGYPTIDPNYGFGAEAGGHRVGIEMTHGHTFWWNPYEGIGTPEESPGTGIMFPFSILGVFSNGVHIERCVLEIVAGIGTWLLLLELGMGTLAALAGGMAFSLDGEFCWIAEAVCYCAAFLPYVILGIERLRRAAYGSWAIIAGSLGLSLLAGFPEGAYLNGLLALGWALIRVWQSPERFRFFFGMFTATLAGIAVSLPPLIAFADYLTIADVGGHLTGSLARQVLPATGVAQLFLPYIIGPIFANHVHDFLWSNVGGYAGVGMSALAIAGSFGRSNRSIRLLLAGWCAVTIPAMFGYPIVHELVVNFPLVKYTAYYRYLPTSWGFALAVLAAFAIDDAAKLDLRVSLRRYRLAIGAVLVLTAYALIHAGIDLFANASDPFRNWLFDSLKWAIFTLLLIAAASTLGRKPLRAISLAAILVAEVAGYYFVPEGSYPKSATVDLAAVDYMRSRIGYQRFYTLGPIAPNYGTYFGIASINYNDLPVATQWIDYIHSNLDRYSDPTNFVGYLPVPTPGTPTRADELRTHVDGFQRTGVRFVVTPPDQEPFTPAFETATGKGDQSVTQLDRSTRIDFHISGSFGAGRVQAVELFQGNYNNLADGVLDVTICDGFKHCGSGRRALRDSQDNTYFKVPLSHPLSIRPPELTVTIRDRTSTHPEALWTFPAPADATATLTVNGKPEPEKTLRARFDFVPTGALAQRVFHDAALSIYQLPHPSPYLDAPGCALDIADRTNVAATCSASSELHRLEFLAPGWHATVNGATVPVSSYDGIFQRVVLMAGKNRVHFWFLPPYVEYGYATLILGLLSILVSLVLDARRAAPSGREQVATTPLA